jgi:hypothetical protein
MTVPLRDGLVPWPGDRRFDSNACPTLARGDVCTFSTPSMSAHAGTHIDAPLHCLKRGRAIDVLPVDATAGPARVVPIHNPGIINPDELRPHRIRSGSGCWDRRPLDRTFQSRSRDAPRSARGGRLDHRRTRPDSCPHRRGAGAAELRLLGFGTWDLGLVPPQRSFFE